jgi:hypothetical protein
MMKRKQNLEWSSYGTTVLALNVDTDLRKRLVALSNVTGKALYVLGTEAVKEYLEKEIGKLSEDEKKVFEILAAVKKKEEEKEKNEK